LLQQKHLLLWLEAPTTESNMAESSQQRTTNFPFFFVNVLHWFLVSENGNLVKLDLIHNQMKHEYMNKAWGHGLFITLLCLRFKFSDNVCSLLLYRWHFFQRSWLCFTKVKKYFSINFILVFIWIVVFYKRLIIWMSLTKEIAVIKNLLWNLLLFCI
jgi:hypothetical protein